jgi:putative methionine-R-sulfoxide reductase with GAF domain
LRNLFRVNPLGQCLTADILLRNQIMEEKIRGRSRLAVAIQVLCLVWQKCFWRGFYM